MGRKSFISKLVGIALVSALGASGAIVPSGGKLEVANFSLIPGIYDGYAEFLENLGANGNHFPVSSPKLDITYDDGTNTFNSLNINPTESETFSCALSYDGTIPDGTDNFIHFDHYSPYESNVLITYNVTKDDLNVAGDVRQVIQEGNYTQQGWGQQNLGVISNAVDGETYATIDMNIAPIETTITDVSVNDGGSNATLQASARPGTVAWPEYKYDLNSTNEWTVLTNKTQYLPVTTNNFGDFDSLTWTNLPYSTTNGPTFYRLGCDSYGPDTLGLLEGSEPALVSTPSSLESLTVEDSKVPSYRALDKFNFKKDAKYKNGNAWKVR
jgi:hypothetical protein